MRGGEKGGKGEGGRGKKREKVVYSDENRERMEGGKRPLLHTAL